MNIDSISKFGFIKFLLDNDAQIAPLEINYDEVETLASMNPSIWITPEGKCYINVRAVNYNLFNSRYRQYNQGDQPIAYVCKAASKLKTENYFGTLDLDTLNIEKISKVKMLELHEPNWIFTGLEDARIINWDENIYLCGVRRDIKDNGEGRMELSKIEIIDDVPTEIERTRMPAAGNDTAYLEKNWMPIIDQPYTWIKWCLPLEICSYDKDEAKLNIWFPEKTFNLPFRGDSHVIHIGEYYYCFVHYVMNKQLRKETNARVSLYNHYVLKLDENLNAVGIFGPFLYDNRCNVEFGCGMALYNNYCYLTYAENDAAAYIIKFHKDILVNLPYKNIITEKNGN